MNALGFNEQQLEGLTAQQPDAEFNALLNGAVQSIFEASTVKEEPRKQATAERKGVKVAA